MTERVEVDGVVLEMPVGWHAWKYDDSAFHRNQFQSFAGGSKAVDAVARSGDGVLWLIEVKDYRKNRRSKPSGVYDEVALKVKATLAGLAAAQMRANDQGEAQEARSALRCDSMRVALQLMQPDRPSKLFPQVVDPADAQTKLRQVVRAVDPRALCSTGGIRNTRLPWQTVAQR